MFDKFKSMGAIAGLMKNQHLIKEAGDRVRARMEETRVIGEAGGGAARATVTGTMKVLDVELSPALVGGMAADDRTRQLASALIAEAINNAMAQAQQKLKAAIDTEAKALGLDGLSDMPGLAEALRP